MILVVLEFLGLMMSWLQGRGEISNEIPNGPTCGSGETVEIFMIFTYFGAPDKIVLNAHEKSYQVSIFQGRTNISSLGSSLYRQQIV